MKNLLVVMSLALAAGNASAMVSFQGSDTLAGVMTDAIIASGMNKEISYAGGGSGKGEAALMNGEQGLAPMSREVSAAAVATANGKGISFVEHVIALDGLGIFVNASNTVAGLDLPTVKKIFTCEINKWEQIPGSNKSGAITVYRRNDFSGTTDAFKHFTGIKTFGACVTVLAETADIAEKTSKEEMSVAYAGGSAKRDGNRAVPLAKAPGQAFVEININTVRSFEYPMARKLFVYEVRGARTPNVEEAKLLQRLTDRSFMDPIVQDHEFYTID